MEQKQEKIFISEDGTKFFSEEECLRYESHKEEVVNNLKFYRVSFYYQASGNSYLKCIKDIAVHTSYQYMRRGMFNIVLKYIIDECGGKLFFEDYLPMFNIKEITQEEYFTPCSYEETQYRHEKIFLSPNTIKGLPDNFDYTKVW